MNVCFYSYFVIVGLDVDLRRVDIEIVKMWVVLKIWYVVLNLVYSFNDCVVLELVICEVDFVFFDFWVCFFYFFFFYNFSKWSFWLGCFDVRSFVGLCDFIFFFRVVFWFVVLLFRCDYCWLRFRDLWLCIIFLLLFKSWYCSIWSNFLLLVMWVIFCWLKRGLLRCSILFLCFEFLCGFRWLCLLFIFMIIYDCCGFCNVLWLYIFWYFLWFLNDRKIMRYYGWM